METPPAESAALHAPPGTTFLLGVALLSGVVVGWCLAVVAHLTLGTWSLVAAVPLLLGGITLAAATGRALVHGRYLDSRRRLTLAIAAVAWAIMTCGVAAGGIAFLVLGGGQGGCLAGLVGVGPLFICLEIVCLEIVRLEIVLANHRTWQRSLPPTWRDGPRPRAERIV
jgi:hypothetical protein